MSAHPSKATETVGMSPEKFFADFERGGLQDSTQPGGRMMLKLKDFPPDGAYADAMGRDAQVSLSPVAGTCQRGYKGSNGRSVRWSCESGCTLSALG